MDNSTIQNITKLRVAVAVLGEHNGWWKTKFFSSSSKSFLDFVFPRSKNIQITGGFYAF